MLPANDFICRMSCEWGPNAKLDALPGPRAQIPAGLYNPPYAINNANNQACTSLARRSWLSLSIAPAPEILALNAMGLRQPLHGVAG